MINVTFYTNQVCDGPTHCLDDSDELDCPDVVEYNLDVNWEHPKNNTELLVLDFDEIYRLTITKILAIPQESDGEFENCHTYKAALKRCFV